MDGSLDIETSYRFEITVIGIYRKDTGFRQLVGGKVNRTNLRRLVQGLKRLVTYNGSCFDLPVIRRRLGLNLEEACESIDLKYLCWERKLYGGLKKVERQLGISRRHPDIDGREALRLWDRYKIHEDREALRLLLQYNQEDVMNMIVLRDKLADLGPAAAACAETITRGRIKGKQ